MSTKIHYFNKDVSSITIPSEFTFPFAYTPHPLSKLAVEQVQDYLSQQTDFEHNFGLFPHQQGLIIGKMFGVLVVQDAYNQLGFLAAFSGKLANKNQHAYFVPPVYDLLDESGYFLKEEERLNELNREIDRLEQSEELTQFTKQVLVVKQQASEVLTAFKTKLKENKKQRDLDRALIANEKNIDLVKAKMYALDQASKMDSLTLKKLKKDWNNEVIRDENKRDVFRAKIQQLKKERKTKSNRLQQKIFSSYTFLNAKGKNASLLDIFSQTVLKMPPAGAGECAAPKLLQYAYLHNLSPVAMAEFWWGQPPLSEVRQHKQFYPACKGKCEPILGHMLKGLKVAKNPMLEVGNTSKELDVIFEDDDIIIVNKPPEVLSVPGRNIEFSIYSLLKLKYPQIEGPILVHRLDMSTSGILVATKNERSHNFIQRQFIQRTMDKRYVAVLDGVIDQAEGEINLPLAQDFLNRPRQKVDYDEGKNALTVFETLKTENGKTWVYFYPKTGRTHQLRMHAAHHQGLNIPILGDDLYGKVADRLYLHAERISFIHPSSKKRVTFSVAAPF